MKDREEIVQERRSERVTIRVPQEVANASDPTKNAEYQRRKGMTQNERSREAIDKMARDMREFNQKQGKEVSFEESRRMAEDIANKADRKIGR